MFYFTANNISVATYLFIFNNNEDKIKYVKIILLNPSKVHLIV